MAAAWMMAPFWARSCCAPGNAADVDREYTSIALDSEHCDTTEQPNVCSIDQFDNSRALDVPSLALTEFSDFGLERDTFRLHLDEDIGVEIPVDAVIGSSGTLHYFREAKFQHLSPVSAICTSGEGPHLGNEMGVQRKTARGNTAIPPPTLLTNHITGSSKTYQQGDKVRGRCFSTPPETGVESANLRSRSYRQGLDHVMSLGDILSIRGEGRLARLGETGGFFGHVLLVTSTPTRVEKHTPEASAFLHVWPHVDVTCIWRVPVIESTRGVTGMLESVLLLYTDSKSGQITVLGDVMVRNGALEISECDLEMPENVEIWRCPPELRKLANRSLMRRALADLKSCDASWSWTTAVRAFLLEGEVASPVQDDSDGHTACDKTLEDIQACWTAEPICTSVVITFWQRYLCHLVAHTVLPGVGDNALAVILQYMPLKADRALPGELLTALRSRNWENIARVPLAADPNVLPNMMRINSH